MYTEMTCLSFVLYFLKWTPNAYSTLIYIVFYLFIQYFFSNIVQNLMLDKFKWLHLIDDDPIRSKRVSSLS